MVIFMQAHHNEYCLWVAILLDRTGDPLLNNILLISTTVQSLQLDLYFLAAYVHVFLTVLYDSFQ